MEKKLKVLVVDDEYEFCKILDEAFKTKGYEVDIATSGAQALKMIGKNTPDVMTLDMRMPGLNGYEVLGKAKWINEKMIIVIISAIELPNMKESLMHAGAHAVLNKPVDFSDLTETLDKLLAERSS